MSTTLCPACRGVNPTDALRCGGCGADLRAWDPPRPRPPSAAAVSTGALWLDDLQWPVLDRPARAEPPPRPARPARGPTVRAIVAPAPESEPDTGPLTEMLAVSAVAPDPVPTLDRIALALADAATPPPPAGADAEAERLTITLRDVRPPAPEPLPAAVPAVVPAAVPAVVLAVPPVPTVADPDAPRPVDRAGPAAAAPAAAGGASLSARKAARRAEVRRALLRDTPAPPAGTAAAPALVDVLVMDPDHAAREPLCSLLRAFGFEVFAVDDAARAWALSSAQPFVAAFVDVPLDASDGGAGIELCKHLRGLASRRGGAALLLVLVTAGMRPVDRVRADLAGCDATLLKPVTRGSVARVLDSHGVALPADARRG